ncbi:glycosyltransferase [Crystallibacter degradans]|uniref:glycosyltransferase n=1 Tax=Crystallibacter degradans TaxID=2726743 RepID=UPI001474EF29|nr:glycosyltransferase [Arthrobacter sp. SF27]NMR28212.1 hypothetical protein [Arthrobacter sp. SF27]
MSAQSADHILLTRFNLPSVGAEGYIRAREGWLRHRVQLFEHYCLPSVRAQTCTSFSWIIYFDPASPDWLHDRIAALNADSTFKAIFRSSVSTEELVTDLARVSGQRHAQMITTNLDNDDGIASDFVERLQAAPSPHTRTALYLSQGLIKNGPKLYSRVDRNNAFCSVRESWSDPMTCWVDWHNSLYKVMPLQVLDGPPAWLQVIHGVNVSNRVHGRLVAAPKFAASFPGLLDDVETPSALDYVCDRGIFGPSRLAAQIGKAALKRATMRLGGREGLDRLKTAWITIKTDREQGKRMISSTNSVHGENNEEAI